MLTTVLFALGLAGGGQPVPPPPPTARIDGGQVTTRDPVRRPPPDPKGTSVIRGRVVGADTGTPIRRATVNLSMTSPPVQTTANSAGPAAPAAFTPVSGRGGVNGVTTFTGSVQGTFMRPKSVTTDAQGAFEFRELPPGYYRLSAVPNQYSAAYLPMAYGAKRPASPNLPSDPGTAIELADGQVFDKATIGLVRGSVITGRVTDDNGDPLARASVYTIAFAPGATRGSRGNGNAQTDDLGQFRMFGLQPGEYVVAAEARSNNYIAPNAPPETEEDKIGYLTTYFPGTADDASAQRLRTRAGGETPGVEIRMVSGRLFHVNGMVTDSQGRTNLRANGSLLKRSANMMGANSTFGFSTDEQGRFQMRNIPPGNYRLTVRQQPPPGARNTDGSPGEPGEFVSMPISIVSDMDNILVMTSPGATITGTIVFENGPPQLPPNQASFQMRVNGSMGDPENMMGAPMPPAALVGPDLTFTMKGLSGEFMLRTSAPDAYLKSVQLGGGEDITDTPREFKTGDRVTLVMTSRASTLEGAVTDAAGKPATEIGLILFSDDKASWRNNSIRTRRASTDPTGHYKLTGLLAGRYFLIALPRDRMGALGPLNDPAVFEALAKEATTVVVGEDEQRQVDVKVSSGGQ